VTLPELTPAYAPFANQGLRINPVLIRRVEDRSCTLRWETPVVASRAVSPETASLMSSMLSDVAVVLLSLSATRAFPLTRR
jgi:membrane peptidoglycan carboxypeptidase